MLDIVNLKAYNKCKGDVTMSTTPTQVRIDSDIKKQATALFNNLGLDMSSAINLFLHQCVLRGGLPFAVEMPQPYNEETVAAMNEFYAMKAHPEQYKRYSSFSDAINEVLEDDA